MHTCQLIAIVALGAFFLPGCDRQQPLAKDPGKQPAEKGSPGDELSADDGIEEQDRVPTTLDEALDLMMAGLTDEDRKAIERAGDDYATSEHFGSGAGMRNAWGLWGDSPLSRYFARLGIYHADDMSAIINESFSRRVRGKPIELDKLVRYYRDYWEETDTVAPLDLKCPTCGKEMVTFYFGSGVSAHPDREYFRGNCPDGHDFLYYHRDGWLPAEKLEGDQVAPSDEDKPSK